MADNQKRDSKGRFKSKPKGFDAPKNVAIPDKPDKATKPEKESAPQKARIRLVKNPVYQPVKAARTMEDALQPVKDARSKKKRDKARKEMENTFGDIDWESKQKAAEVAASTVQTESHNSSDSDSSSDFMIKDELPAVTSASSREELISASGKTGEVWVKNYISQEFALLAQNAVMKFIYAEDATGDTVPDNLKHQDHVHISGDAFSKTFAIGEVAFISANA